LAWGIFTKLDLPVWGNSRTWNGVGMDFNWGLLEFDWPILKVPVFSIRVSPEEGLP